MKHNAEQLGTYKELYTITRSDDGLHLRIIETVSLCGSDKLVILPVGIEYTPETWSFYETRFEFKWLKQWLPRGFGKVDCELSLLCADKVIAKQILCAKDWDILPPVEQTNFVKFLKPLELGKPMEVQFDPSGAGIQVKSNDWVGVYTIPTLDGDHGMNWHWVRPEKLEWSNTHVPSEFLFFDCEFRYFREDFTLVAIQAIPKINNMLELSPKHRLYTILQQRRHAENEPRKKLKNNIGPASKNWRETSLLLKLDSVVMAELLSNLRMEDAVHIKNCCRATYHWLPKYNMIELQDSWRGDGNIAGDLIKIRRIPPMVSVSRATGIIDWADQGWGNRKGRLFLKVSRDDATFLVDLFGIAPHERQTFKALLGEVPAFSLIKKGTKIELWADPGGGGGHSLSIAKLKLIFEVPENESG